MTHAAVLLPALAGFASLAQAMERHQEDLFGKALAPARTRALRIAGWLLLLLSLGLAVARMGWGLARIFREEEVSSLVPRRVAIGI